MDLRRQLQCHDLYSRERSGQKSQQQARSTQRKEVGDTRLSACAHLEAVGGMPPEPVAWMMYASYLWHGANDKASVKGADPGSGKGRGTLRCFAAALRLQSAQIQESNHCRDAHAQVSTGERVRETGWAGTHRSTLATKAASAPEATLAPKEAQLAS